MTSITNINMDSRERALQEERRRILQANREKKQQRAIETRRKIIIGGIVIKYFPDVISFNPKLRQADTDIEFAELEEFIAMLANDPKHAAIFHNMVASKG